MNPKNKRFTLALILCILSLIGTLFIYSKLPLEIPIHFNTAGEVDNYGPRSMVFLTGLLPLGLLGLFIIIPRIDPKKKAYYQHSKAYEIFIFTFTIFLIVIHWCSMSVSLGIPVSINKITPLLIGILFIIIGNYMPQIRQNYTFGIRIPWALDNAHNWRITHRVGGYSFIVGGLLFIIGALFSPTVQQILSIVAIVVILVIPTLASYIYFKKLDQ